VTSQVSGFSSLQGTIVSPSGRLPSSLERPVNNNTIIYRSNISRYFFDVGNMVDSNARVALYSCSLTYATLRYVFTTDSVIIRLHRLHEM